jgi:prevent-host-death family protein
MKVESLREVKNNLSRVIEELPDTGPVLITRNGKGTALLIALDEGTDVETLLLSGNKRFWELFDRATQSRRWMSLKKLR